MLTQRLRLSDTTTSVAFFITLRKTPNLSSSISPMAPKKQEGGKLNKRKQFPAKDDTSASKKPKFASSDGGNNNKFKKPFKPFNKGQSNSDKPENTANLSKRDLRIRAKELTEARKKRRKQHYTLEQELAYLWEKIRQRNIAKEERSKLITQAIEKMKGKIPEIAGSHVSSRVLQSCVKHCSQSERDTVFEELKPHMLTMTSNTYAVHLVMKMLDNAPKKQLAEFISILRGHVAPLLRHMVGSVVVEHAYQLGNAAQKQELLMELYSPEFQLFKDLATIKETRLVDVIAKLNLQKGSVLRHMASVIEPILEKGIIDHSITHRAVVEYLTLAGKSSAADVIQHLSGPSFPRMIHTKDGSQLGIFCIKHGSAKQRRNILKAITDHVDKIARDQYGSLVLSCILSTVDDTKRMKKLVLKPLRAVLKELVSDKNGRRPLLQLLHPNCSRYFSPDDIASLNLSIPSLSAMGESKVDSEMKSLNDEVTSDDMADNESKEVTRADEDEAKEVTMADDEDDDDDAAPVTEGGKKELLLDSGLAEDLIEVCTEKAYEDDDDAAPVTEGGKKDAHLRRQELLLDSGLAEDLIEVCIENAEELLRSNFGKEVLYEITVGGHDGILHPTLDEKLNNLHEAIASLVAEPKSEDSKKEHVLENFHSSRVIRKLILDSPAFAKTLWTKALKGNCKLWAEGHSSKVIRGFLESNDPKTNGLAKKELQGLIDGGILKLSDIKKPVNE